MSGAAAAGAGNQQRMATEAAGTAQQQQALSAGLQNVQTGYGASNAMNQLLGTAMSLKYPPLGQTSTGSSSSSGEFTSWSGGGGGGGGSASGGNVGGSNLHGSYYTPAGAGGGSLHVYDEGGYVPPEGSPSDGARTDDVKAKLDRGRVRDPQGCGRVQR